jgi:hypothetical protein
MRIRTGLAATTSELAGYLRGCECSVVFVDEWTLEVAVRPESLSEQHAQIELEGYLQVWGACIRTPRSIGGLRDRPAPEHQAQPATKPMPAFRVGAGVREAGHS